MSGVPKPVEPQPVVPQREMNEEDFQALMASEMWLWKQDLSSYEKQWIAVLGETFLDSDADKEQLYRRLDALGTRSINTRC